jgi:hypothetical protein
MARGNNAALVKMERHETALGALAHARALLELVRARVEVAAPRMSGLLSPAIDDLDRVEKEIIKAQERIAEAR